MPEILNSDSDFKILFRNYSISNNYLKIQNDIIIDANDLKLIDKDKKDKNSSYFQQEISNIPNDTIIDSNTNNNDDLKNSIASRIKKLQIRTKRVIVNILKEELK